MRAGDGARVDRGSNGMDDASLVALVPHTHWDREWYEPFQRFRLRLVALLDDVLARAAREPAFCFTLDGQMAAVDDYLEVRPERADEVAALVREGRLAIGPWRVLLDEFLCSGENIVRNLELGLGRAAELGGAMPVGYLPDEFGHAAQVPQILARAGLRHACLWRGVPASVDTHAFRWQAPDGSWVRCEYLALGYGNVADLFDDPDHAQERARERFAALEPWFVAPGEHAPVLAMYGTDHAAPLPTLMDVVRRLDADPALPPVEVTTLQRYVRGRDPDEPGLATLTGELRSHARANILPGVISVRWQLKDAMARAERMVERWAEPLAALWLAEVPGRYLTMAWTRLVDSSCHDSVTGCGVDETALQVQARLAEAEQLGRAVRDQAVAALAATAPGGTTLVLNPTPQRRRGQVTIELAVPEDWDEVDLELPDGTRTPTQTVAGNRRLLSTEQVPGAQLGGLFRRVHGRELFGRDIVEIEIEPDAEPPALTFHVAADPGRTTFDAAAEHARVEAAASTRPGPWQVRILDEPRRTVHAEAVVPALGFTTVHPVRAAACAAARIDAPVSADETGGVVRLAHAGLTVEVQRDGTLTLTAADGTRLSGVGRLVDGGDVGDTYNYGPPARDELVTAPETVQVRLRERGPLRAVAEIARRYLLPAHADLEAGTRAQERVTVDTTLQVELRAGEPFARLRLDVDNRVRDHRLRLHVPTAVPAERSAGEGQFAVVERGQHPEPGEVAERPIPTYPASGFVDAGGAGVLLTRPTEYELVAADPAGSPGTELALTVVRSVGWLSRNLHPYRDEPAGPQIPTPAAQVPGAAHLELAVMPHAGDWAQAGLVALAERFHHELLAVPVPVAAGSGERAEAAGVEVTGAGVVLTSLRRRGGALELRVVAETADDTEAVVSGPFTQAHRADLLGRPEEALPVQAGRVRVPLRAWEIATLRLTS